MTDVTNLGETGPADHQTMTMCLSDIEGFESLYARMPTPEERRELNIRPAVPVLVVRRHGEEQLYRADQTTLTIDPGPPPTTNEVHDATSYLLGCILEEIENILSDVAFFNAAMSRSPRNLVKIAAEFRQRREDEFFCAEPCPSAAGQNPDASGDAPPDLEA